jgi:acylphosphatase
MRSSVWQAHRMAAVRRRVTVSGRVQGVFFRASTREVAEAHGATGFARNEPDGTVIVEAQGEPAAVDAVERFCRTGPPQAVVRDVAVEELAPLDGETGFVSS